MSQPSEVDSNEMYAQREDFIRSQLAAYNLIPHIETQARKRGFDKDPAGAVNYVIAELARDETAYRATNSGSYEPEQYALLADIYLAELERSVTKRKGTPTGPVALG